ncbi:MAG: hypothetical protein F6K18_21290 [Okeania sp. SIO2C2]|uniref:hypothetical protein n=1 Tax=Okeania sp. SIO2C2 TaxID=2607787 RepID=UPI0013BB8265|nr:hypothetical protein [Okeania sp. SIO2C2]NEP89157.1 hypothetical protein [Okeania sp. SIO2C2]
MVLSKNYWTLCKIDLTSYDVSGYQKGYREDLLLPVQQQFQIWFPSIAELKEVSSQDDRKIQATLLSHFLSQNSASSKECSITAGLSLRCYISHGIVHACQKLAQQFGDRYGFSHLDLLYLVLTDDGKIKNFQEVSENSQSSYPYFWAHILRTFNPDKAGLWNWTYLLTRRHPELTRTLWVEFGLSLTTPWGKLNEIKRYQMETLSPQERDVVEAFHGVYRRDRREQGARGKCPEPSESQLQEMRDRLCQRRIIYNSSDELLEQLKTIAKFLQEQIFNPTEISPPSNASAMELEFLDEHRDRAIMDAIEGVLYQRLQKLQKSAWYSEFAPHFLPSLRLIYCEKKSQSEVAKQLNMNNQSQVSRILKLKQLLKQIREQVMEQLLQILLNQAELNSNQGVLDPNAFDSLIELLSRYLDETVFLEAAKEISTAKKYQEMTSLFAQKMRYYLEYSQPI